MLGSLVWALADYWPGNMGDTPIPGVNPSFFDFTFNTFIDPAGSVMLGFLLAVLGAVFVVRYLPQTTLGGRLILQHSVGVADPVVTAGGTASNKDSELPLWAQLAWPFRSLSER